MEDCPLSIVRRDGGRKFNGAEKGQATYYRLNQIDIFSWNPKIRHILSSIKIWAFQFFSKMGLAPRCLAGQFMRHLKSLCEKKKGQTSKSAGLSARFCFRSNSTPKCDPTAAEKQLFGPVRNRRQTRPPRQSSSLEDALRKTF